MKRMMSTITLCLASLLPLIANAEGGNLNGFLRGDYAFSGDASCIASSTGFSGSFALKPYSAYSYSVEGVRRFNGDGTGTISGRTITINNGNNGAGIGPVVMGKFTATFNYTVALDHSIHIDTGLLKNVQTVGPNPGATGFTKGMSFDGHVSQDFNTITVATAAPDPNHPELSLEYGYPTTDTTGNPAETIACHRSRVMVKIDGGPGRDASQTVSPFSR